MGETLVKQSKVTAKYQVTIPREVREQLRLKVADALQWKSGDDGRIYVTAAGVPMARYKSAFKVGRGDIHDDVEKARRAMGDRFR